MPINHSAKTSDEFRQSVVDYIKEEFSDLLGEDVSLLDLPNGLELIKEKYKVRKDKKVA